ncbi:MAG: hypothetical protein KDA37_06205 [Planctomycetales bacterium]|nr:hypothetical protein [Planctomycetales bacterium]
MPAESINLRAFVLLLMFSLWACVGTAEEAEKKKEDKEKEPPAPIVTQGTATIAGKELAYTATAGKLLQKADDGQGKAEIFYVAYTAGKDPDPQRPITFCFNGGPGSSSVWLHLGMLGPYRVKAPDDASYPRPPYSYQANPHSLLDVTDLVFIDPVSTGYSRPADGEDKKQFHGYREDLQSVGQFIHDYTSQYGRWGSPKFLLGESYGGLRAAGLAGYLQDRYRLDLNGVVLVSAVVDFRTIAFGGGNDLANVLFLPSYAATAWYHKALDKKWLDRPVEDVVAAAERFARGPYLRALTDGSAYPAKKRERVVAKMSELTGLSPDYIERADLRVAMWQFGKELLRDRGQVVGRFDGRYVGFDPDHIGAATEHDPSGTAVFGLFTSAINQYLRDDLKVEDDHVYEILTDNVQPWNYGRVVNDYVSSADELRNAMASNPFLKVFAACGYYDLATPQFAMQYTRDHLELPRELLENFTIRFYEGGHMMYAHEPSLAKLREDLLEYYRDALGEDAGDQQPDDATAAEPPAEAA